MPEPISGNPAVRQFLFQTGDQVREAVRRRSLYGDDYSAGDSFVTDGIRMFVHGITVAAWAGDILLIRRPANVSPDAHEVVTYILGELDCREITWSEYQNLAPAAFYEASTRAPVPGFDWRMLSHHRRTSLDEFMQRMGAPGYDRSSGGTVSKKAPRGTRQLEPLNLP